MDLSTLEVYQRAMRLGELIWNEVQPWRNFDKDTIGKQLVRSVDSVAANIGESHGRHFYKDRRLFCFYARGSLQETGVWLRKARNRDLMTDASFRQLSGDVVELRKMLNGYIRSLRRNLRQ